jgi:hypothetical protein
LITNISFNGGVGKIYLINAESKFSEGTIEGFRPVAEINLLPAKLLVLQLQL